MPGPMKFSIGAQLTVTTVDGTVHTGQLYILDEHLKLLVLVSPIIPEGYHALSVPLRPSLRHAVSLVSLASIKTAYEHLKPTTAAAVDLPVLKMCSREKMGRRQHQAFKQRQAQLGAIAPKGTSDEALAIFTAISKTLPCSWYHQGAAGQSTDPIIVVMGEIFICPPYTSSSCRGTMKTSLSLLERVKKVV